MSIPTFDELARDNRYAGVKLPTPLGDKGRPVVYGSFLRAQGGIYIDCDRFEDPLGPLTPEDAVVHVFPQYLIDNDPEAVAKLIFHEDVRPIKVRDGAKTRSVFVINALPPEAARIERRYGVTLTERLQERQSAL